MDDFRTKIAKHLGLKINISTDGTYVISLEGLTKIDDECCTCEIAIDTSTKHHGEYKGNDSIYFWARCISYIYILTLEVIFWYKIQTSFVSVLRSSPDLGDKELQRIEKCLNETNDVAGLIATLRKKFKACI